MALEPADAAARQRALDPARSFIVQAPAGSGKTGLLTQRFLRLLAVVDAPEQIVAITFTLKAAAEMRRRVLLALRGVEPGADANGEHDVRTRQLAQAARAHAEARGWALEQHPARLRIQTIDAFCHALAAQSPVLARAGAELEIAADDALGLYRAAARSTLARVADDDAAGRAVRALLRHRDNQVLATESLIVDMLARRDQWLPLVLELRGAELRARLERDLAREVRGHLRAVAARMPKEQLATLSRLLAAAAERLEGDTLRDWRGCRTPPAAEIEELARWRSLGGHTLTDGKARRKVDVRHGFPPEASADKEDMHAVLAAIGRDPELIDELAWLHRLPDPRLADEQWQMAEELIEVLKLAAAELELVFRETGEVDFPAVLNAAWNAVRSEDAPTEAALALDRRIRHLLVDEYQDTSSAQFGLLTALTAGWTPGDGRTVFCVGDPMQSIYRFRQAEVGLFLRTRDRGLGNVQLEPLQLGSNFRSQRALVDWFNAVFARILPAADDIARGAVRHAPSSAIRQAGEAAVRMHPVFTDAFSIETGQVLAVIHSIRLRSPEATIGVLARQRLHVAHLAAALRESGVRFQAVELETLGSRPVVRDLLALTRALLHEGDRTAWLSVLRSPMCGLTLADLEALIRDAPTRTVRELLSDPSVVSRLSEEGRARATAAHAALAAGLEREGSALHRRVERLWLTVGGPAAARDAGALEDAAAFFNHLQLLERRGALPAGEGLEAEFVQLFATVDPQAPPQLQLMTIHKAKGLEFDVVILPGLGRAGGRDEAPLLNWLEVAQPEGPAGLLLAPIARKGADGDPHARYVAERERECRSHEHARLLYVAVTRARQELHLFGHVAAKEKDGVLEMGEPLADTPLQLLWPSVREDFERAFASHGRATRSTPGVLPPVLLRRHRSGWRRPPPDEAIRVRAARETETLEVAAHRPRFEWASEVSRHVGTVVHAELDRWSRAEGLPTPQQVHASRPRFDRLLAALGVPLAERERALDRIVEALARTLADDRGRWLFSRGHTAARSELALSGAVGSELVNVVIDRTFVDAAGTRWIIDFKTSTHEGAAREAFLDNEVIRYRTQLARYATLMARLGPEPVRLGLYFPMLSGWREWAAAME